MHMEDILEQKKKEQEKRVYRWEPVQFLKPKKEPETMQREDEQSVVPAGTETRVKALLLGLTKLLRVEYPEWAINWDNTPIPMLRLTPHDIPSVHLIRAKNFSDEGALKDLASLLQEARELLI